MKNFATAMGIAMLVTAQPVVGNDADFDAALCADSYDKFMVREFYRLMQPGSPPPIPSRELALVETKIVSGLPASQSVSAIASRERYEQVWKTIDTWGADNDINIVLTIDGWHAFNFPSKVPITHTPAPESFYDMYADDGNGLHAHVNPDLVSMINAVKLPARDGTFLRAVNFYDDDGDLIAGFYATEAGESGNDELLNGFQATWDTIASLPTACGKS